MDDRFLRYYKLILNYMKFQHFLITQFNLRNFWTTEVKDIERWINWTKDRIKLFEKYCLPSVLNQRNQNFSWVIFMDRATPAKMVDELKALSGNSSLIQWCFMDGYDDFKENYLNIIRQKINPNTKWIITTNLDNDDALHKDAIQSIQENFVPIQDHLISLANGFCLDVRFNTLSQYFYPRSPFLSLIEKADSDLKGIHHTSHTKWEKLKLHFIPEFIRRLRHKKNEHVTYILNCPLWIQVVHGQNVSNSFYRGIPVRKKINLEWFGISQISNQMGLESILKYRNYYLWKRYIYCSILRLLRPPNHRSTIEVYSEPDSPSDRTPE